MACERRKARGDKNWDVQVTAATPTHNAYSDDNPGRQASGFTAGSAQSPGLSDHSGDNDSRGCRDDATDFDDYGSSAWRHPAAAEHRSRALSSDAGARVLAKQAARIA